ncbi:hypothetical protein Tco_1555809 [Tanacetum coccineum]
MSQPANDEFSQHLSDEESNHEDASDTGVAPKQQQQQGSNDKKQYGSLLTIDDGIVHWGELTKAERNKSSHTYGISAQALSNFCANEIYEKDEKLKRYRRIGMKAVKEKEQLQKTVDSWKDSSKNLEIN